MIAVGDSGGEAQLVADHARALGFELPEPSEAMRARLQARWPHFSYIGNPVDPWGVDADFPPLYDEILQAMADEDVDIVAVRWTRSPPGWATTRSTSGRPAPGR